MAEYLVTGGAGFIGSNIVDTLVRRGAAVRVLDNFSTGRHANLEAVLPSIELVEGDLRDAEAVRAAVQDVRYVIHLAALPSVIRSVEDPETSNNINVNGTLRLLLAARDARVDRLVLASSSSIYGDTPELPKRENMLPQPLSPYALSKLAGEHYCRMFHSLYGLKTYALRYFNVFGPRQDPRSYYAAVIPLFIEALQQGRAPVIYGDGEQTRDFTFVSDIVAANLRCCEAPEEAAGGAYNVAWGNRISIRNLAERLAHIMQSEVTPVHEPARPGDVRDSQADARLARERLGWEPKVTFEDGLEQTVRWFLEHPAASKRSSAE